MYLYALPKHVLPTGVGERILVDKPYNIKFHNMIEGCFFVTLIHFIFFINVNNANS